MVSLGLQSAMPATYTLDDGAETHREFPDTFEIPSQAERERLCPGDIAKLMFRISVGDEVHVERMWVQVVEARPDVYIGSLDNDPYCTKDIKSGDAVQFHSDHVIQILRKEA